MKIKKIIIQNINSLKGRWEIDLEHPDYSKNHNQFVICGETGSGKTTILDAVTLALYGKTPRMENLLAKIKTEAFDEIMTRHTAESESTVIYECRQGVFESSFTMHKAHGKTDGKLSISFAVKDLKTKEQVCDAVTAYTKIEDITRSITNLGYEQFCRSMLLAQGKFDKFISAEPRERAEILAAISGTDYAAMARYIRSKGEKVINSYTEKEKNLKSIEFLDPEIEKELKKEQESLPVQKEKKQEEIDRNNALLVWLDQLEEFTKAVEEAERDRRLYDEKVKIFSSQEKVLENAERARLCQVPFEKWQSLNMEQKNDHDKINGLKNELSSLKKEIIKLTAESEKSLKEAELKKEYENILSSEWNAARKLLVKKESEEAVLCSAKKSFDEANEKFEKGKKLSLDLENEIKVLKKENDEHEKYLSSHEADSKLQVILPVVKEKLSDVKDVIVEIEVSEKAVEKTKKDISITVDKITALEKEYSETDSELKELVTTRYIKISEIIRASVQKGKPCPVCGSENHPLCETDVNANENEKEKSESDVAEKITVLTDRIEKLSSDIQKENQEKVKAEADFANAEKNLEKNNALYESLSKEIVNSLSQWTEKLSVEREAFVEELDKTIERLKKESELYNFHKECLDRTGSEIKEKNTKLEAIVLSELEKVFESEKASFEKQKEICSDINNSLSEIGNGKYRTEADVENSEVLFKTELEKLIKDASDCQKALTEAEKKEEGFTSSSVLLETKTIERENLIKEAFEILQKSFKENGFASVEEFEKCILDKKEIAALEKEKEALTKAGVETDTKIKTTSEKLKEHKATAPEKDAEKLEKEDLLEKKKSLSDEFSELSRRFGEIDEKLCVNEKNREKARALLEELEGMRDEKERWDAIIKMLGIKSGSDFQTFVQALAFRNLIKKANKYFEKIMPNYSLVQVPGTVDFKIHSINFKESRDDREIGNLSGGERFILSLSFALGIAELASRTVKVDSLFLDEGFGTLSGDPLNEAIDALKGLELSGKMLGVITHVTEVIDKFPQRIEAVSQKGTSGYSMISGSGIKFIS